MLLKIFIFFAFISNANAIWKFQYTDICSEMLRCVEEMRGNYTKNTQELHDLFEELEDCKILEDPCHKTKDQIIEVIGKLEQYDEEKCGVKKIASPEETIREIARYKRCSRERLRNFRRINRNPWLKFDCECIQLGYTDVHGNCVEF